MGEVYVWNDMGAGNWEAPGGKGKFDIETGWAQKVVERYAPTYLSSPLSSFVVESCGDCPFTMISVIRMRIGSEIRFKVDLRYRTSGVCTDKHNWVNALQIWMDISSWIWLSVKHIRQWWHWEPTSVPTSGFQLNLGVAHLDIRYWHGPIGNPSVLYNTMFWSAVWPTFGEVHFDLEPGESLFAGILIWYTERCQAQGSLIQN